MPEVEISEEDYRRLETIAKDIQRVEEAIVNLRTRRLYLEGKKDMLLEIYANHYKLDPTKSYSFETREGKFYLVEVRQGASGETDS